MRNRRGEVAVTELHVDRQWRPSGGGDSREIRLVKSADDVDGWQPSEMP
jgi:hypothetical protein